MESLAQRIGVLRRTFDEACRGIADLKVLQDLRNQYLSRKRGYLARLLDELKSLPAPERPGAGGQINALKDYVQGRLDEAERTLTATAAAPPGIDLSLPGRTRSRGAPHPLMLVTQEIEAIFLSMGFAIEEGPEIETDYYNFEALNFPPQHPARDDWDTLYTVDNLLLRTHTSPVQIRVMERRKPPIRIICPGRVFRHETPDATHLPMFYQVEGLVVDEGITFANLKGTLEYFLKAFFGEKVKVRFRPSFFPFTEPSAEVDIECLVCGGKDAQCRVCGGTGWKEILGAGMVDPQVFKNVNIDPERYTGWAFGLGVERAAMIVHQLPEMKSFYENDLRFIRQFMVK
jgi:phenylalanyl-tRNA synthetase alpha chain